VADSQVGPMFYAGRGDGTFPANPGSVSGPFPGATTADLNADKLADGVEMLTSSAIGVVLNTTPGFWLGASASVGPLRAGGSANGTVSVNPQNGFSNAVSLTCSASHPSIHCSLSPSSLSPGTSSTLTVTTIGNSGNLLSPTNHFRPRWLYAFCLPMAFVVSGLSVGARRHDLQKYIRIGLASIVLAGILSQIGCGGDSRPGGGTPPRPGSGTPAGNFTITVTGTSGVTQHSTAVKLTVQ
jgi:hypothetical protein